MTSLKRHFLKNLLTDFSKNFGGRRQIDAGEGTKRFASISAAVFEASRKSGMGAESPPPAGRVLKDSPEKRLTNDKYWDLEHLSSVSPFMSYYNGINEICADSSCSFFLPLRPVRASTTA